MNRSYTNLSFDAAALAALGGTVAFTASVYGALPERMVTHFGLRGEPNGFMDRSFATWGVDAFALVMWAAVRTAPRWLPRANDWRSRAEKSPIAALSMLAMVLVAGVSAFIVWNGLHPEMHRLPAIDFLIGAYALAYSLVLPRTRRNPFFGVRTVFSLTSDENWALANRFGSYAFMAGGLACIVGALVGAPLVGLLFVVAASVAPSIYSWTLAHRLPPEA